MFRSVRNKKNEITVEEAKQLLAEERRGVLAINGEDDYPYAIPINYLYLDDENKIIFHGARKGYKVDALKSNNKVCFTVYGREMIKDEAWAPYLRSTVAFGRCRFITDEQEKIAYVKKFAMKYYPSEEAVDNEIAASAQGVQMFEISIEHITGKEIQEK